MVHFLGWDGDNFSRLKHFNYQEIRENQNTLINLQLVLDFKIIDKLHPGRGHLLRRRE